MRGYRGAGGPGLCCGAARGGCFGLCAVPCERSEFVTPPAAAAA